MDREYMQEVINGMRKIVKPYLAKQLKKINFEGCGNTDKAEFETDFEIVLTLAEQALAIPSAEPKTVKSCDTCKHDEAFGCPSFIHDRCENYSEWEQADKSKGKALEQEPKTGHWIIHGEPPINVIECSECGQKYHNNYYQPLARFCSMCGAKMVEPQEREVEE